MQSEPSKLASIFVVIVRLVNSFIKSLDCIIDISDFMARNDLITLRFRDK